MTRASARRPLSPAPKCGNFRTRAAALLLLGLAAAPACARAQSPPPPSRVVVELAPHFAAFRARGAFVLHDERTGRTTVHDPEMAARRFIPASSFKIPNSLIALETGVVSDEHDVVRWDGVDRGNPSWNRDLSLAGAFRVSAAWVYQELARRVGAERMAEWVRRLGYGNAVTDGPVDRFWLNGRLLVSAEEQIAFLRRMKAGELPVSRRSLEIVRRVMLIEEGDGWVMRGKTGWAQTDGRDYGWLVGWVERGGNTYYFATHVQSEEEGFPMMKARLEITRGALRQLGALP